MNLERFKRKIDVNDETLNEKYYYNNKKALEEIKINNIYSSRMNIYC